MKTITMDFEEYDGMAQAHKEALNELAEYKNAILLVYGKEIAGNILSLADDIEHSKNVNTARNMLMNGKL